MSDQTVIMRKLLSATCEEVFDAWLDADGMRQWMRPGAATRCEAMLEPRVGGHLRIVMTGPDGETINTGTILALERPSRLQFSWVSTRWSNQETLVTVELRAHGAQCELVLTHERFPARHSAGQLTTGWTKIAEDLGHYLRFGRA